MKNFKLENILATLTFCTVAILGILAIAGWILNIVALTQMSEGFSGMFIVRIIGIFVAPMGSILGFM